MPAPKPTSRSIVVALITLIVLVGVSLANLVQAAPGDDPVLQPLPTEEPPRVSTIPPGGLPGLPTVTPTPRVRVTEIPPQRATEAPPQATEIPTTEPLDPQPPVEAQPTESLPPAPGPGDQSDDGLDFPQVPWFAGSLQVTTRICPPAFDLVNGPWDLDALATQCTIVPYEAVHGVSQEWMGPPNSTSFVEETNGSTAWFTLAPGNWWLKGSIMSAPVGSPAFKHLAVACTTPPDQEPELAVTAGEYQTAMVTVKFNRLTSCVRYVHLPVETGNLTVHVWQCPAGYDLGDLGSVANDCATPLDGLRVYPFPGGHWKAVIFEAISGDDGPGTAAFTTLIPGDYAVRARSEPYGSNPDWQYVNGCGDDPLSVGYPEVGPGEPPPTNGTVVSGQTTVCNVYIVPGAASALRALEHAPDFSGRSE